MLRKVFVPLPSFAVAAVLFLLCSEVERKNIYTLALDLSGFLPNGSNNNVKQTEQRIDDMNELEVVSYGADISFPMTTGEISTNYPWLPHNTDPANNPTPAKFKDMPIQPLGDKKSAYDEYLRKCRKFYGKKGGACDAVEHDRFEMSLLQPRGMVNYTETGYKKIKAPEKVYALIKSFYDRNKGGRKREEWFLGNTYTNHWDSPTYMVSIEDTKLRGGGATLKQKIWAAARATVQEWTGTELTQCSLYGVRVYEEGAVLAPHVDRLPLVASAIINVDQDVDEPWPIEVIGHDGVARNVTMEPGDMVLYESHSVIHGRPFPLKGRFYANIFVHFEPTGHSLRHHGIEFDESKYDVDKEYKENSSNGIAGHEHNNKVSPSYVVEGSIWEQHWLEENVGMSEEEEGFTTGSTDAHKAAQDGDLDTLMIISKDTLKRRDANGWEPIHEAARSGHHDVLKFLLESGVDVNARTTNGGQTPLAIAIDQLEEHPIIEFLRSVGAEL